MKPLMNLGKKCKNHDGNYYILQNTAPKTRRQKKVSFKHLRIKSAAWRRLLALLRAFIPRHPDWITITIYIYTHARINTKTALILSQREHPNVSAADI